MRVVDVCDRFPDCIRVHVTNVVVGDIIHGTAYSAWGRSPGYDGAVIERIEKVEVPGGYKYRFHYKPPPHYKEGDETYSIWLDPFTPDKNRRPRACLINLVDQHGEREEFEQLKKES